MEKTSFIRGMVTCCQRPDSSIYTSQYFDEKKPVRSRSKIHKGMNGLYKISLREQGKPTPAAMQRRESSFIKAPNVSLNNSTQKSVSKKTHLNYYQHQKSSKKMSLRTQASPERKVISQTCPHTPQSSSQIFKSAKLFKKKQVQESRTFDSKTDNGKKMNVERKKYEEGFKSMTNTPVKNLKTKKTMEQIRTRAGVKKLFELNNQRIITQGRYKNHLEASNQTFLSFQSRMDGSIIVDESIVVADYFQPTKSQVQPRWGASH